VIFNTTVLVWKCLHDAAPRYLADLCAPVPRNIIAGLKIAPPRRTLRRNKFAGGEHIPGENPPGEKIMPPSLKQKPPPVTTEQLQLLAGADMLHDTGNVHGGRRQSRSAVSGALLVPGLGRVLSRT